jgi:NADH:ubiquinone oxidoreductase subunit E
MITVTVCVGSSCHVKGARGVINNFKDLLASENLEDKVELKGSFCMERCGEGINWTINDEFISSLSAQDSVETLHKRLKDILENNSSERPTEGTQ